ncbi:MAG: archaeosortase/exosortase family protein [Chloroflexi bacterium]|nr:archaeosortase/exosortase family protein [Chloroflexota bacterium]
MSDSPLVFLIETTVILTVFAVICYFIARRRLKQPVIVFLGRFVLFFSSFLFLELVALASWPSLFHAIQSRTATFVGGILSFAGMDQSVSGWTLVLQNHSLSFDIGWGCLGGELFWTYIALVLAETTATDKQRLVGILVGLAILLAFNFFRITLSIYLEGQTGFDVHSLFYIFNMIFVLLVWFGWLWTIRRRPARFAGAMS